jgi:hypothetical protein
MRWARDPEHLGGSDRRVRPSHDEKTIKNYDWKKSPYDAEQRAAGVYRFQAIAAISVAKEIFPKN